MTKGEILKVFAAGFEVGPSPYEDNLLLDERRCKENELLLLVYDANMFPTPEFCTFSNKYKTQVIKEVLADNRVRNELVLKIYIDEVRIK